MCAVVPTGEPVDHDLDLQPPDAEDVGVHREATTTTTGNGPVGMSGDAPDRGPATTRDLLVTALATPLRPLTRTTTAPAACVLLAEVVGFVVRRACSGWSCGDGGWATRLDMDALGSLPRGLITLALAGTAVLCLIGIGLAGRSGAALWWAVLAGGCGLLAAAKHASVHSLLESRLAGVLPGADVQLLFVVVSCLGLLVAVVSGRWVRRDTRAAVVTWLALYAAAGVGLAAVTLVVAQAGPVLGDVATLVEESGEGLAAVGLLAAVRSGVREVAGRR